MTRTPVDFLLAIASALLLVLTFPRFNLAVLAAVALAPLLVAIARETEHWRRFLLGCAAGIVYWFGVCYWIQNVLELYGGLGAYTSWLAFLLFCAIKALHMGVFALLAGLVISRVWAVPAVAAIWVAIERTHATFGFAWLDLGNAGIDMSVLARLAPYTGVYGLSFLFAMMSTALALAILRRPRRELLWLIPLPLLYLLPALPDARRGNETAVLVQPNLSESENWTRQTEQQMHERLLLLSTQTALMAGANHPQLLAWPEAPAPLYYYTDAHFRQQATNLARVTQTWFLMGTVAFTPKGAPLNSVVLISPAGDLVGRYDKMNLVPFGEFVPWPFGFVNKITKEAGEFAPGKQRVMFQMGDHRMGTFICYESVFPDFVRRFAAEGAELLVNISNDGYFGKTAARDQHLKIVRMRAAENRRWILRATNDGITVSIDPAGRVIARLPAYEESALRAGYSYENALTPYTRYGDWFVWVCVGLGLAAVAGSRR